MATQWGRKETIIWPPHVPMLSYTAVAMAIKLRIGTCGGQMIVSLRPHLVAIFTTPSVKR